LVPLTRSAYGGFPAFSAPSWPDGKVALGSIWPVRRAFVEWPLFAHSGRRSGRCEAVGPTRHCWRCGRVAHVRSPV